MMSTHRKIFKERRLWSILFRTLPFSVCLLLTVQLFLLPLSATTLAAPRLSADPPEDLALAGVSLVRLLVSYNDTDSQPQSLLWCTGLGVLVDNWSAPDPQLNTTILTDGNLVNTNNSASCVSGTHKNAPIEGLQIFFNGLYNGTKVVSTPLLEKSAFTVTCSDTKACENGPALVSFHSALQLPFVTPSPDTNMTNAFRLALTNKAGAMMLLTQSSNTEQSVQLINQVPLFLTPTQTALNNDDVHGESGAPLVSGQGQLLGVHLANGEDVTSQGITTFLQQEHVSTHPKTTVQQNWSLGVIKYYEAPINLSAAKSAFQKAAAANPQFLAASDFASRANSPGSNTNGNGGKTPVSTPVATPETSTSPVALPGFLLNLVSFGPVSFPLWLLLVAGILALLVLFAVISLLVTAARRRQEYAAAERKATIEAQRIAAMEANSHSAQPQQGAQSPDWLGQPTIPIQQSPVLPNPALARTPQSPSRIDLRCPRCKEPVPAEANYCSNCSLMLSPTESGFHLRIKLRDTAPHPIVLPSAPAGAPFPPNVQSQPTQTSQLAAVRPASVTEHPTLEMHPPEGVPNGAYEAVEPTTPLVQMQGRRLGFAVGTHSDPGIKRKFKPNEDSLFAAQGPRDTGTVQTPFGLFVVADGMGGHAMGQDASRRAIQNLIDYMLPRLLHSADASSENLQALLQEGVQQANLAVHSHNMELRADMGTTITATLVVDSTAYVCNVGDSRTYLYRPSEGLRKVTNDHSVVASLVEAGIIKPDDIYTHPKRNQIYRSLGEKANVEVDAFQVALQPGDKMLLCSDGLWDMVRDPKIEDVIKSPMPDPNQTASALINAALEGGGEDNVSVIVISMIESAQHGLSPDFRLIAKPDTVQLPQL